MTSHYSTGFSQSCLLVRNSFRVSFHCTTQRKIVIVENIRLGRLLDLTADFGAQTNAKLTPIFKLGEKSKKSIRSCMYTVTLTPIFALIS